MLFIFNINKVIVDRKIIDGFTTYVINDKIETILVIGDIHGNFKPLYNINDNFENCVLVTAGDNGFGFDHIQKDLSNLRKLQRAFEKTGNQLFFMRGNHDKPSMYNSQSYIYDNVRLVSDYSILDCPNIVTRVLMVGGSISIDRSMRTIGRSYWTGEDMYLDKEKAEKVRDITHVITHGIFPPIKIKSYLDDEFGLLGKDIRNSEKNTYYLYQLLINNNDIKKWYFGHLHESITSYIGNTHFVGLNIEEYRELYRDYEY